MPANGKPMRTIREILRLSFTTTLSDRMIAQGVRCSHTTVALYTARAKAAGLSWPLPADLSETDLRQILRGQSDHKAADLGAIPVPDWEYIHRELSRKGVTLKRLWCEYIDLHPDGYRYSRFCDLYRLWSSSLHVSMRMRHTPGEKLFVDYSGITAEVIDPDTGEVSKAEIFVAALGYSHMIYAEATRSQKLEDWLSSHVRALEYFGGVPKIIVPDNLRSGVSVPCRYDPETNPAYGELAEHYQVAVIPARVRRPKDKAKVEKAVQMIEYQALAVIRDRRYFSMQELNNDLLELVEHINSAPFQKLSGSRRSWFEEFDRPALQALPQERFVPATWTKATVSIDYHVVADKRYYSVPYKLCKKVVEVRLTASTVEMYHELRRVASHCRSTGGIGHYTTLPEHMPSSHRRHAEWTPERMAAWAATIGPHMRSLVDMIMNNRTHPEQGFRTCVGIVNLNKGFDDVRLESLATYALRYRVMRLRSLRHILERGIDLIPTENAKDVEAIMHPNVRGPQAFTTTNSIP